MQKVVERTTGEIPKSVYYDEKTDTLKQIKYEQFNYVISAYNGKVELLYFEKPFSVPKHIAVDDDMINDYITSPDMESCLGRTKFKAVDGVAVPVSDNVTIADLQATFNRGGKRAKKNFYNYALANNWQYFCTYTFNDETVRNDKDLLYLSWQRFIKSMQYKYPDIKAIAVYEAFVKGGYHIHALLSNCILTLRPAVNPKTNEFIYSKQNNQIFNCLDWQNGFNNICCINPESNNAQVVNYLGSYMTKESPAPYRCKRYFHTQNLNYRESYFGRFKTNDTDKFPENFFEIQEYLKKADTEFSLPKAIYKFALHEHKRKNGVTVYRNY